MQDRIAARKIEVRQTVVHLAKVEAVVKGILHLLPRHTIKYTAGIAGENIAMLAPLITFVGDMPLKGKILFHRSHHLS